MTEAATAPRRGSGAILAVLVLLAGLALVWFVARDTGDDDPFADYCSEVEDRRDEIGAARAAGEATGLIRALPDFEALADKAPRDIKDEWRIVVSRITDLRDALADAGVDATTYDPAAPPEGISVEQQEAIQVAAERLGSEQTSRALTGVEQQARDVCKTPLSL